MSSPVYKGMSSGETPDDHDFYEIVEEIAAEAEDLERKVVPLYETGD